MLTSASKMRLKGRFPVLSYLHEGIPLVRATHPVQARPRRCVEVMTSSSQLYLYKLDQDEKMMSAILGNRPRGFLLDLQSGSKAGVTSESELSYPGWKRVVNKVPSLQELRESLSGLFSACQDVASEKVNHHLV